MRLSLLLSLSGLLGAGAACETPNPKVCCLDAADCGEIGLSEVRPCMTEGYACVEHECVPPSCAETGCAAEAPVCNVMTDVCVGCADSADCARFSGTPVCDLAAGGSCVQCVGAADCSSMTPVCEGNACRACRVDSECPSGACGDDGACVAESAIVYLAPGGNDGGTCSRSLPCRTIAYAVTQTTVGRAHLVMALGGYTESFRLDPGDSAASRLYIHGGGATLSASSSENSALELLASTTVRDLNLSGPSTGAAITAENGSFTFEDIGVVSAGVGLQINAPVTIRRLKVDCSMSFNQCAGIQLSGGTLTLDGAVLHHGQNGIRSIGAATVDINNALIWGTSGTGIDLPNATGGINFTTVADCGSDTGPGPRALACGSNVTVRSSIVWAPGASPRVPLQGCNTISTIAGPTLAAGTMNIDPQFVSAATRDYHLAPGSPARDMVDSGPAVDFEGDARPRGTRFDIGADEVAP